MGVGGVRPRRRSRGMGSSGGYVRAVVRGAGALDGGGKKFSNCQGIMVDRFGTYGYIRDMGMRKKIDPVTIPEKWRRSVAVRLLYEGTRWYVERGTHSFRWWMDELDGGGISTIPLQFVPEYVGVSREAVLKRAKGGGLTVFSFIFSENTKTVFGKIKTRDSKKRVDLVPKAECEQWRDIIMERGEEGESW